MKAAEYNPDSYSFLPDVQERILALLVRDKSWLRGYRRVVSSVYFEDVAMRDIAEIVLEHFDKYGLPPDIVELAEQLDNMLERSSDKRLLEDKYARIMHTMYEGDVGSLDYIQDLAIKFGRHQAVKKAAIQIVQLLPQEQYDDMEPLMREALSVGVDQRNVGEAFSDLFGSVISKDYNEFRRPIPTGIQVLDGYLGGGIGVGEWGQVIADTGVGKTLTLVDFCAGALLRGHRAYYASLEDPVWKLTERLVRRLTGKTRDEIAKDREGAKALVGQLLSQTKGEVFLNYFPPGLTTLAEIEAAILRKEQEIGHTIDVVFLDYLDKVKPRRARKSTVEEIKELAEDFDAFIKRDGHERGGWTASQVNTEGAKAKTITHVHAYGGRAKGHPAAVILTISQTPDEKAARPLPRARLYISKNRDNPAGKVIPLIHDGGRNRLIPQDNP